MLTSNNALINICVLTHLSLVSILENDEIDFLGYLNTVFYMFDLLLDPAHSIFIFSFQFGIGM